MFWSLWVYRHDALASGRSGSARTMNCVHNGLTKLGLHADRDLLPYLMANGLMCELDLSEHA